MFDERMAPNRQDEFVIYPWYDSANWNQQKLIIITVIIQLFGAVSDHEQMIAFWPTGYKQSVARRKAHISI